MVWDADSARAVPVPGVQAMAGGAMRVWRCAGRHAADRWAACCRRAGMLGRAGGACGGIGREAPAERGAPPRG